MSKHSFIRPCKHKIGDTLGYYTVIDVKKGVCKRKHKLSTEYILTLRCVCGKIKEIQSYKMCKNKNGKYPYSSCGCMKTFLLKKAFTKHGFSYTSTYRSWNSMISRCTNKNYKDYAKYGAIGIRIEDKHWLKFDNFLKDMGPKPPEKNSIDRIDSNKGYFKENCVWANSYEQNNHRKSQVYLTAFGITLMQQDWARKLGIWPELIIRARKKGLSLEQYIIKRNLTHLIGELQNDQTSND